MFTNITDGVKQLLIINVLMFVGASFVNTEFIYSLFSLYFPENNFFQPWQILSHMFMHGNFTHLLFNMIALFMFGTAVERMYGTKKFMFLYFSAGFGAAIIQILYLYFIFYTNTEILINSGSNLSEIIELLNEIKIRRINESQIQLIHPELYKLSILPDIQNFYSSFSTPMVGASGAIMGILVAFGFLFPESKLMLLFFPFPIKAKYFIPGIILLDLFSAITRISLFSPSNTAYIAHLGGAFIGFIITYYWKKNQFNSNRWN